MKEYQKTLLIGIKNGLKNIEERECEKMKVYLKEEMFTDREFVLVENKNLKATAFRYSTGVAALKVENERGYFIILPFMGQQIWRMNFDGRDLTMKTTFEEPIPNVLYLQTYGGFLYHCGISSVGAPDESHLQHGEIPNIKYKEAYIITDEDEKGAYMTVGGCLDFNIGFVKRFMFMPACTLRAGEALVNVSSELKNMRKNPMEYAYLCHINFAPIDGAKLYYNAELKTVHKGIPEQMEPSAKEKLKTFMDNLEKDIHCADVVGLEDQIYEPEICSTMMYQGKVGQTLQYKEGVGACYVKHDVEAMPYAIRWISRTECEDAMGMVLPCTCEHLGYKYVKENNQIKYLNGNSSVFFNLTAGWVDDEEAKEIIKSI